MSEDNFQSWIERVVVNREAKPLDAGEVVKSSAGQGFGAIEFVKVHQKNFLAEVGRRGDYYIYHFFPLPIDHGTKMSLLEGIEKAFPKIFKDAGEVEFEWVPEMNSAAVRVSGWTNHVWGDELALRVVEVVQEEIDAASKPTS